MFILPACTEFIGGGDCPQTLADHTPGKGSCDHPKKQQESSHIDSINPAFPGSSGVIDEKPTTDTTRYGHWPYRLNPNQP
jgi:hypothetical protein